MILDMAAVKETHGLAQARKESERADPLAVRVGTKLFRDGHRKGFWDGVQYVLENVSTFASLIDWRELASVQNGHLPARWLRTDDRVIISEVDGVVIGKTLAESEQVVHITVRTDLGAQLVFERTPEFLVRVLECGDGR